MKNKGFLFLLSMMATLLFHGQVRANTHYKLVFHADPSLKLDFQTFELPPIFADKVGTNANIIDVKQLTPIRELKNDEFDMSRGQSILIGVAVKGNSGKALDFFVSPHHTNPAVKALDFSFSCLCYHHVYHLEAGKIWYRVLKLTDISTDIKKKDDVVLVHEVLRWEGEVPDKTKTSH